MQPFDTPRLHLRPLVAADAEALLRMHADPQVSFHEASRRAEIGYVLAREVWGRGLMHEALSALVALAFQTLNLNRLEADIDPRNTASTNSLARLGFVQEGFLRERWIVGSEVSDTALFGLLRSEWAAPPCGEMPALRHPKGS